MAHVDVTGRVREFSEAQAAEPLGDLLGPEPYARTILLNMGGVEMLNSNGIGWLLTCHRRVREAGGSIVLHGIPPLAANVLKMMRMDLVFDIANSKEDAIRLARGEQG